MPVQLSYPGVYVEEVASGVRAITGVATSITAFVGRALRGPLNKAQTITSYGDFERVYGGLWLDSQLGYAVRDFYGQGGTTAVIVRVHKSKANDTAALGAGTGNAQLKLVATAPGAWGNRLTVSVDKEVPPGDTSVFNLTVTDPGSGRVEVIRNISHMAAHPRRADIVVGNESSLVKVGPLPTADVAATASPVAATGGNDGDPIDRDSFVGAGFVDDKEGLYALDDAGLVNLVVVPPYKGPPPGDLDPDVLTAALKWATDHRAVMILDPPPGFTSLTAAETGAATLTTSRDAAVYFPRIRKPDPLRMGQIVEFPPAGTVAGVIARTDATRGVWKAPAGLDARIEGVSELAIPLTDREIGLLNPLGVNCLRVAPGAGHVVWGARTRDGADRNASEWKYLPVRRTALFIEESLYRGTQWVVFEPNDAPLWAQIRLNVTAFMNNLFRQGAFAGTTPKEAYLVKCDAETTTQDDVNLGIVNIVVGFAPLKPAEFVVLKLQQLAGQTGSA